jgi:hypothetical protein
MGKLKHPSRSSVLKEYLFDVDSAASGPRLAASNESAPEEADDVLSPAS